MTFITQLFFFLQHSHTQINNIYIVLQSRNYIIKILESNISKIIHTIINSIGISGKYIDIHVESITNFDYFFHDR